MGFSILRIPKANVAGTSLNWLADTPPVSSTTLHIKSKAQISLLM